MTLLTGLVIGACAGFLMAALLRANDQRPRPPES